jgi:histidinol-phosphatase (PHP family)
MTKDYHIHTFRCKHATGDVPDYVEAAIKKGASVLGFSDHTPLPDGKWSDLRMSLTELESYIMAIEEAQRKHERDLTILKGMECEYADEYRGFYQEELLGKWGLDYLIAAGHFFPCEGSWIGAHSYIKEKKELFAYTDHLIAAMSSGLFTFVAHPDLFGHSYLPWDENAIACSHAILEAASDLQLPLEINGNGFRQPLINTGEEARYVYPLEHFWELAADYEILAIVNSDAHSPEDVLANTSEGLALAERYQLKMADLSFLE